jgi:hypothetical protein
MAVSPRLCVQNDHQRQIVRDLVRGGRLFSLTERSLKGAFMHALTRIIRDGPRRIGRDPTDFFH